jgi:hypothetical protein
MIKLYVSTDSTHRTWTPDNFHEVRGMNYIIEKMWLRLHPLQTYYGIFANMHHPNADMVIFTERGLGVLELKDYYGKIHIGSNESWYANDLTIRGGSYLNPLDQVQNYALELREQIMPYFPGINKRDRPSWNEIKTSTGVCFTHPNADIQEIKRQTTSHRFTKYDWEDYFTVMAPKDVPAWACCLRFRGAVRHEECETDHPNFHIIPESIEKTFIQRFHAVEWKEMLALMPPSAAYGYLILKDSHGEVVFPLTKDDSKIGRHPEADVVIPAGYDLASHTHCLIERTLNGIYLSDLESKNGTFVKGKPIQNKELIKHGSSFILGDKAGKGKSCTLRFEIRETSHIVDDFPTTKVAPA